MNSQPGASTDLPSGLPTNLPTGQTRGGLSWISLNRPETINALTPDDISTLTEEIERAIADPDVTSVLLTGNGERGFCAGGDIKIVREMILGGAWDDLREFWASEYRLDHLIATSPTPVVSVAHRITFGGGMGLTAHAAYRLVTEDVQLSMPEVLIGLGPDVGMQWRFARAPGESGVFAGLTAARLGAGDALHMGLADAIITADQAATLPQRLAESSPAEVVAGFATEAPSWVAEHQSAIDELFAGDSLSAIGTRLEAAAGSSDSGLRAVAEASLPTLRGACPTALAMTLSAVRRAAGMSEVRECFEQDLRMVTHAATRSDMVEGIRARVLDKDRNPQWIPARIDEVSAESVDAFFASGQITGVWG